MSDKVYTVLEVAARLKISERTVRRFLSAGTLAFVRVGRNVRIEESEIKAYLDARRRARKSSKR